jgi:hypothetical protein
MIARVVVGKIRSGLRGWIGVRRQQAFFALVGNVYADGSLGFTRVSGTLAEV